MLPIAPSTPTTAYNKATTSPPTNWLLEPASAIRFRSNVESSLLRLKCPGRTIGDLVEIVECPIAGTKQLHQPILQGCEDTYF